MGDIANAEEEGGIRTSLRMTLFLAMLHLAQKRMMEAEAKANILKYKWLREREAPSDPV